MNDHPSEKELFIRVTASAFRKLLSTYVFSCFPFGFEGRMWDLIVSVPDHCLSFYFDNIHLEDDEISFVYQWLSQNRRPEWKDISHLSMNVKRYWAKWDGLILSYITKWACISS